MAKERILVPENLRARIDQAVALLAKRIGTTEADARKMVERAVLQRGLDALEREHR